MPNKYGNISEIAQYNRENGTNFYTMEQVEQHRKENNPSFLKRLAQTTVQVPVTSGVSTSTATSLRDIPKVESTVGNELGYAAGLLTTPMLLGEIGTYGPLVGALRLGAGTAGSAAGSYIAGKAGDFADKKLGTNWIGDTGRLLGGFAGFGAGMKSTTPLLQRAAARNISLGIPKETFVNLRKEGLSGEVTRALNRNVKNTSLNTPEFRENQLYEFLKTEWVDKVIVEPTPKPDLTSTYHYDPRVKPLSRPISEFERNGKYTLDELHQMGFKLPRKHLQGEDAVQMFKEYGTKYPETTRLYRVTGTSGNFTPSPDGTAEFAGQWFTNDPNKVWWYGENTLKEVRRSGVENPIELQVVDIPTSQLEKFRAKNIIGDRKEIEFEPEDFIIPLETPRGRAPLNLTGNQLIDQKVGLPQIATQDTPLMKQLRKYVPEARERYGLVRNTNITDDEIAGSLYKKALELGGNTAAVNEVGEPLVLFRGDTKRFPALRKVAEPESLAKGTGSMDNSFGNLFLGQLDRPGEGVERYIHYVHQYPGGATEVYPSATGERLVWNGNKIREQGADIYIPEKYLSYDISEPFNRYRQQIRRRKISSELAKPNSNDINAFVIRTPSIRNSSYEISPEMGGEFIDINGVPKFKNSSYVDRNQSATRIRQILTDAESKGQGLLKSDAYSPLRENEHFEFDYYALPNFNIRNAKHLLPYDFRIKPQWGSRLIYRKQGGILKRK